jgi:hypothetical protein
VGLVALGISPFVLFILLLPPPELDPGFENGLGSDLAAGAPLEFPYEAVSPPNRVGLGVDGTESPTLVAGEDQPARAVRRAVTKAPEAPAPAPVLPAPVSTAGDLIADPETPKPEDEVQERPRRRAAGPPTNEDLNINPEIGDDTPDAGPDEQDPAPQDTSQDQSQDQSQTPSQQDSGAESTPEE